MPTEVERAPDWFLQRLGLVLITVAVLAVAGLGLALRRSTGNPNS